MRPVICGVDGSSRRLQPVLKVDPRDRDTWLYPECEECGRPACEVHATQVDGRRKSGWGAKGSLDIQLIARLVTKNPRKAGPRPDRKRAVSR